MDATCAPKPQRVLMLVENNSFPWDRRIRHLASTLQGNGYEVTVISPKGQHEDTKTTEAIKGVKIYRYPMLCQATGGWDYLIEYSWSLFCMAVLSLLIFFRHGFDVIHVANPPDLLFLIALPFKWLGKKFVYDQHDLCPELYLSKFQREDWLYRVLLLLEQKTYSAADLVISTNQSYQSIARERGGVRSARSVIVRNGVDMQHFHRKPSREELKQGFRYLALYLGVMGKQDGVDGVIRAAKHVVDTLGRRDVLFALIGTGECLYDLQTLTRQSGLDAFVRFPGRISDELLLDYLSTADVCLAPDPPDLMNQLSTMTKIMEYMACERPIVSFDLLETRRSAGDAAVYVEGGDPRAFAEALDALLQDPIRREEMGRVGLERSMHLVGLDRSQGALLDAYSRMLGGAGKPAEGSVSSEALGESRVSLSD